MKQEAVHEEDYRGYKIKLYPDEDPADPRKEWDNAGTMVCWHRRYTLGDEQPKCSPNEWMEEHKNEREFLVIPLYLYDHSGITMRTGPFSCPWDSGQVGWIYISRERIHKEWGKGPQAWKKARACLESEVKVYDQYLTGDVYGYVIENRSGEHVDSIWGYYGHECCIEEARRQVDWHIKDTVKKHIEYLKGCIKNKVPVIYRQPCFA